MQFINSFMTDIAIINFFCNSMDWFLYDSDLRPHHYDTSRKFKFVENY